MVPSLLCWDPRHLHTVLWDIAHCLPSQASYQLSLPMSNGLHPRPGELAMCIFFKLLMHHIAWVCVELPHPDCLSRCLQPLAKFSREHPEPIRLLFA